jgi:hypothetical protein
VPSVEEPVGRLEGIGKQAVATLKALGQQLEDSSRLPQRLHSVEKVGAPKCTVNGSHFVMWVPPTPGVVCCLPQPLDLGLLPA